jgi:hypothetical protein
MEIFDPKSIEVKEKNNISIVYPNPTTNSKINVNH